MDSLTLEGVFHSEVHHLSSSGPLSQLGAPLHQRPPGPLGSGDCAGSPVTRQPQAPRRPPEDDSPSGGAGTRRH